MTATPQDDVLADLIARCPEHGYSAESWPECRCAAARKAATWMAANPERGKPVTAPEGCRPVYCVAGPCAGTCLRMDDPNPIEMLPDRLARTAARIREARDAASDDSMPPVPLARAADLYHGRSAPTARELALYAEACGVSVDWLLAGVKDGASPTSRPAKVELPPPSPALVLHQAAARLRERAAKARIEAADNEYWDMGWARGVENAIGGPAGVLAGMFTPDMADEIADWLDEVAVAAVRHARLGGSQAAVVAGYPIRTAQRILGEAP